MRDYEIVRRVRYASPQRYEAPVRYQYAICEPSPSRSDVTYIRVTTTMTRTKYYYADSCCDICCRYYCCC